MRSARFVLVPVAVRLLSMAACGGSSTGALPVCSPFMPAGTQPSAPVAEPSASPADAMAASGACAEGTTAITRAAASDIAPMGYTALGSAVTFSSATAIASKHGIDLVVPCDLKKAPAGAPPGDVVVVEKRGDGSVLLPPVSNVVVEDGYARLHFHTDELGTYQAAIPSSAGSMTSRHFTFRAIAGVSMGGLGSSVNFWRHPDRYDAVAVMGADPGPDLTYTLGILQDWFFGGFCTADDAKAGRNATDGTPAAVGKLCPLARQPDPALFEESFDFEHLHYQKGEGVGLTLRRSLYVRAFRDLSRAFGNGAYATAMGASTYLPPDVPAASLSAANADACSKPTVLMNFYDRRYNPDGALPVITFCDGGDSEMLGLGVFDPAQAQTDPTQVLLAVDVNKNGKRDSGEPVVLQASEPFRDVGSDGKASKDEPGYDPVTNPDPSHDDYHPLHNPTGTEGNWRYDMGEPYDDVGTDGVAGKGCPVGSAPGCYDFGEGNHQFDYNLNIQNWRAHDPRTNIEALAAADLARLDVYYDAGIHDFLDAQVSTSSLVAALVGKGEPVRVWEGFPSLVGIAPAQELKFDPAHIDWTHIGHRNYVRYGDPDASAATVESTGDGRHVGTVLQATHRAEMLFYALDHAWPGGDRDLPSTAAGAEEIDDTFTTTDGRQTPYVVLPPPGYAAPENAARRYPVVYLMHGYGMKPMDLASVGAIAQGAMTNGNLPTEKRLQKFIIVVVDGDCRPGGDISGAPVDQTTGDLCEEGTFYSDHADGPARMEKMLLELQALIDQKYRTKMPADLMVTQ